MRLHPTLKSFVSGMRPRSVRWASRVHAPGARSREIIRRVRGEGVGPRNLSKIACLIQNLPTRNLIMFEKKSWPRPSGPWPCAPLHFPTAPQRPGPDSKQTRIFQLTKPQRCQPLILNTVDMFQP